MVKPFGLRRKTSEQHEKSDGLKIARELESQGLVKIILVGNYEYRVEPTEAGLALLDQYDEYWSRV